MNAVGIDVSKGKSMVAVVRPFGELVVKPYEVRHTSSELGRLESAGAYWAILRTCGAEAP